jgi:hypothetical protein
MRQREVCENNASNRRKGGNDRAILLEGGEGPARIKKLRDGSLHLVSLDECRECHNPRRPPRPIAT